MTIKSRVGEKCKQTGKTKYATEQAAQRGITFLWGNDSSLRMGDLEPYVCPHCKTIHIRHARGKRRIKRIK